MLYSKTKAVGLVFRDENGLQFIKFDFVTGDSRNQNCLSCRSLTCICFVSSVNMSLLSSLLAIYVSSFFKAKEPA